jgi:hypothetical protein
MMTDKSREKLQGELRGVAGQRAMGNKKMGIVGK